MPLGSQDTCPLPDHPVLAETSRALNRTGLWSYVLDREYRVVFMTDELRLSNGGLADMVPVPLGERFLGPEFLDTALGWTTWTLETGTTLFAALGPWMLADAPGGRDELRELVDPRLRGLVDELAPAAGEAAIHFEIPGTAIGGKVSYDLKGLAERIWDPAGELLGFELTVTTAVGMSTLGVVAAIGDLDHFARMQRVARAARRPAAILFADLEGSSALSRHLSTASYFSLGRRLAWAADSCVIEQGGLVGRHVGDGFVAFFLAETAGSESAAARGCISAARTLRGLVTEVAGRSGLKPEDVTLRFGLHWGSNPYVGNISTPGRSEVTALGDEVNEAARIESSSAGGRTLASKSLVERLDPADAALLGLDVERITYVPLGDLPSATDKARRDAPAIPVCELPPS